MSSTEVPHSRFTPPKWLRNHHAQTIWQTLFRRVNLMPPVPERLDTDDDDFLDLDWYRGGNNRLLVVSHGLEGNARRPYVLGLARAALEQGWDVLAWNFRSCSGEMNRQPRFYHSGASDDLGRVVDRALADEVGYQQVALAGFSMGGNITLVYLGEQGDGLDERIVAATVFSVPCDLAGSADCLAQPENRLYMRRFMKELRQKMREKHRRFPEQINLSGVDRMRTFHEFDDQFTAPLHGFDSARDYWERCSSRRFIPAIRRPTLIVNALDDPFLSAASYPTDVVDGNAQVTLEMPAHGGHVGFVSGQPGGHYWSERRAVTFLNTHTQP